MPVEHRSFKHAACIVTCIVVPIVHFAAAIYYLRTNVQMLLHFYVVVLIACDATHSLHHHRPRIVVLPRLTPKSNV